MEKTTLEKSLAATKKQLQDENEFLKQELSHGEDAILNAKLSYAEAASDKDFYYHRAKQLLALAKSAGLQVNDISLNPRSERSQGSISRKKGSEQSPVSTMNSDQ